MAQAVATIVSLLLVGQKRIALPSPSEPDSGLFRFNVTEIESLWVFEVNLYLSVDLVVQFYTFKNLGLSGLKQSVN